MELERKNYNLVFSRISLEELETSVDAFIEEYGVCWIPIGPPQLLYLEQQKGNCFVQALWYDHR